MSWTITKEFKFEAAHKLPHHDGKCARLHGHSWVGEVKVSSTSLQQFGSKAGMVIDYSTISAALKDIVENYLDHHYLNETTGLENPTSEEIARWIYDKFNNKFYDVKDSVPLSHNLMLVSVTVKETCTSSCTYTPTVT